MTLTAPPKSKLIIDEENPPWETPESTDTVLCVDIDLSSITCVVEGDIVTLTGERGFSLRTVKDYFKPAEGEEPSDIYLWLEEFLATGTPPMEGKMRIYLEILEDDPEAQTPAV